MILNNKNELKSKLEELESCNTKEEASNRLFIITQYQLTINGALNYFVSYVCDCMSKHLQQNNLINNNNFGDTTGLFLRNVEYIIDLSDDDQVIRIPNATIAELESICARLKWLHDMCVTVRGKDFNMGVFMKLFENGDAAMTHMIEGLLANDDWVTGFNFNQEDEPEEKFMDNREEAIIDYKLTEASMAVTKKVFGQCMFQIGLQTSIKSAKDFFVQYVSECMMVLSKRPNSDHLKSIDVEDLKGYANDLKEVLDFIGEGNQAADIDFNTTVGQIKDVFAHIKNLYNMCSLVIDAPNVSRFTLLFKDSTYQDHLRSTLVSHVIV